MFFQKPQMNVISVTAIGIGAMVGAGIFALLGQVVLQAGSMTYWSFMIAGIVAMLSGYSYAKLAATYPGAGGLTNFYHQAFPSKIISGGLSIIYYLTLAISCSMMAKSFGIYMTSLFHHPANPETLINYFAGLIIVSLAILNMQNPSAVGKVEVLFVGIKVFILLFLVGVAAKAFNFDTPVAQITPSNVNFLGSIGITFFAYAGFGVMTNAAGAVQNPQKTIPHAIYLAIGIVIVLYISLAFVVINFIPHAELIKNADTAVAIAAQKLVGSWGYILLSVAALVAFVSGINANFFSIFKISKSLSEQKILPAIIGKPLWRNGTFGNAFATILIVLATMYFNFSSIVNIASAAFLTCYIATFWANWKLRKQTNSSSLLIIIGLTAMIFILGGFLFSIFF